MMNFLYLPVQIAQFGSFEPIVDNEYTQNATVDPLSNLEAIISNSIGFITVLAGMFFLYQFVTAAFSMVTAGGDTGKLNSARDRMLHGVLGMIMVVASYSIVGLLGSVFGLNILNPAAMLGSFAPGGAP